MNLPKHMCCLGLLAVLSLAACQAPATRQWLDPGTAVTITAQREPLVLAREDFPAGVNVRDYAELGLVDINRSGEHRRYVSLVLWSTVDRSASELAARDELFATITLWANDQPVVLKKISGGERSVLLSDAVYRLPSPNARDAYYPLSEQQFAALVTAEQIALTPGVIKPGDRPYRRWRGDMASIKAFADALRH